MSNLVLAIVIWGLPLLMAGLLWPLEQTFPRLAARRRTWARLRTIIVFAALALIVMLAYQHYMSWPVVQLALPLKVFDLASVAMPDWLLIVVSILVLDFLNYSFHVLSHRVGVLWRLHAIHHSDQHVSAISGILHHPIEIILTAIWLLGFTVILGIPVLVYVLYGLIVAVHNAWSHADIRMPTRLNNALQLVLVTPDIHRTHHSTDLREGNSNFGALFTIWDRLFQTYVDTPKAGAKHLEMGLPTGDRPTTFTALALLGRPFGKG